MGKGRKLLSPSLSCAGFSCLSSAKLATLTHPASPINLQIIDQRTEEKLVAEEGNSRKWDAGIEVLIALPSSKAIFLAAR